MEKISDHNHEHIKRPNFDKKLRHDLQNIAPALHIPDQDKTFMAKTFELMHDKYGVSSSDQYLLYHNDIHAYDVAIRALKIGLIFQQHAPDLVTDRAITLAMVAGSGHDIIQKESTDAVTDEQLSADYMREWMESEGYDNGEPLRVADAVVATTAQKSASGVVQTQVRTGSKDPIKLMVALADIQATTMEGSTRMLKDVSRLYFEIHPPLSCSLEQHIEGLSTFLTNQLSFITDRLDSIAEDVRYYFDEETSLQIEQSLRREYRSKGRSVLYAAKDIKNTATSLVDSLTSYIDMIPETPVQASRLAQRALTKVVSRISHR